MLLRFTLAAKESDYFVVSKQLELEISLTLAAKESFQSLWEFHVDLNRNASFISIEEDLQFEDLMKIVSEDFKEEVNADSASCNNQVSDTFASPVSTVQREIQVHTDPASCNRKTSDTFASHVPLNATPVFRSTVQREKQCLLYEGVSTVPLKSLPDFSLVHIGFSPTTRGAGDIKVRILEGSKKMMKRLIKEAASKANSIASQIELLEEIIKAKEKFDFTTELEKLKEERMEADEMHADVKVKVPDWSKLNEKWLLDE
ncbi:hypothetical protein F2Q69_00030011 [Brassica cretica]|uniref:Uncharacterized protein n=1 Tax=Brassica cretica TaxID=69181 RepID=A0A8S9SAH3_BRACR|nr:hypothetical protein F2Q69_00030011 [Brassica cretica]